jgi:hypothetical protein
MELVNHPLVSGPAKRAGLFWFTISPLFSDPIEGSAVPRYLNQPELVLNPFGLCPIAASTLSEIRRTPRRLRRETEAATGPPHAANQIHEQASAASLFRPQIVVLRQRLGLPEAFSELGRIAPPQGPFPSGRDPGIGGACAGTAHFPATPLICRCPRSGLRLRLLRTLSQRSSRVLERRATQCPPVGTAAFGYRRYGHAAGALDPQATSPC